jgi:hypothetical protein
MVNMSGLSLATNRVLQITPYYIVPESFSRETDPFSVRRRT